MDVRYLNPFIIAARDVLMTMIHLPVEMAPPSARRASLSIDRVYHLGAIIDLSGSCSGRVALRFTKPIALKLVSGLTQTAVTTIDHDGLDALGEIASMIVGNAKKYLPCGQIDITTPTVSDNGMIDYPSGASVLVIPLDVTDCGRFMIEAAIQLRARAMAA